MREPKQIVREGYDAISLAYRGDAFDFERSGYRRLLSEVEPYLGKGGRVLDLGCGCGIPVAKYLAVDYRVTGVDFSAVQVERARALVPGVEFIQADMTAIAFSPASFDAIVSFYAIIHVPREEQPELFRRIWEWLVPGGILMATVGRAGWTGTEAEWHGAEMYWSHEDRDTYLRWLLDLGFEILAEHFIPEGDSGHPLFIARTPITPGFPDR